VAPETTPEIATFNSHTTVAENADPMTPR
jgi:hypothetical protein